MSEGFDTYLDRPVRDYYSIPSNGETRSGEKMDRHLLRKAFGRAGKEDHTTLSGGQMQRLAV